jgi:hypothetical protein
VFLSPLPWNFRTAFCILSTNLLEASMFTLFFYIILLITYIEIGRYHTTKDTHVSWLQNIPHSPWLFPLIYMMQT